MTPSLITTLLAAAALGSGVVAGILFVFSNFAMSALTRIKPEAGMTAMQEINRLIQNPLFFVLFFGTTLASVAAAVFGALNLGQSWGPWALAGGATFVVGCFVITTAFNVPLNNALDALDPAAAGSASEWSAYVRHWLPWNHLRVIATLLAAASFIIAAVRLPTG